MNDSERTLANAITSTRSYGATNSRMLTVIDTNLITHHLKPTDTLQGLAIRYGVTVEKLKRLNKLWSNESILAKETILIPSQATALKKEEKPMENTEQAEHFYVKPETLDEVKALKKKKRNKKQENITEGGSDGELGSSLKENDYSNLNDNDVMKDYNAIIAKADDQINAHKQERGEESEAFKAFNDILMNIDKRIETHKSKTKDLTSTPDLPVVGYGDNNHATPGLFSPTRQHAYLEQGI